MTGLVGLDEALEFLGVEPDGGVGDQLVERFIAGATTAIDIRCGPMVARRLVEVEAGVTPDLVAVAGTTGDVFETINERYLGIPAKLGDDVDPWAIGPVTICAADWIDDSRLTVAPLSSISSVDVPAGSWLWVGRFLEDQVPLNVQQACMETIRNRWANEQGALSPTYDEAPGIAPVPWMIPTQALDQLGDYLWGGAV